MCAICGTTVHEEHNFDSGDCACGEKNKVAESVVVLDLSKSGTTYTATGNGSALAGYSTTWTATSKQNASYVWTIKNFNQNNGRWTYIRAGVNGSIATDFAIAEKITQIKVSVQGVNSAGTATLEYSTNKDFSSATTVDVSITTSSQTLEFNIDSAISNGYYRITFKYSSTKQIDVVKVDYLGY